MIRRLLSILREGVLLRWRRVPRWRALLRWRRVPRWRALLGWRRASGRCQLRVVRRPWLRSRE